MSHLAHSCCTDARDWHGALGSSLNYLDCDTNSQGVVGTWIALVDILEVVVVDGDFCLYVVRPACKSGKKETSSAMVHEISKDGQTYSENFVMVTKNCIRHRQESGILAAVDETVTSLFEKTWNARQACVFFSYLLALTMVDPNIGCSVLSATNQHQADFLESVQRWGQAACTI